MFSPWVGKVPWRRRWQPAPVFLLGKSYGQRRLRDYSPQDHKESDMIEGLSTNTYMGRREGETLIKIIIFLLSFPILLRAPSVILWK